MLVVSVLLLGEAEAGCNQNGCCYCHKDQGYVLTSGLYQDDCDYGCEYLTTISTSIDPVLIFMTLIWCWWDKT